MRSYICWLIAILLIALLKETNEVSHFIPGRPPSMKLLGVHKCKPKDSTLDILLRMSNGLTANGYPEIVHGHSGLIMDKTWLSNGRRVLCPRVMGDQINLAALSPRRRNVQQKIVFFHNYFRTKVEPTASNMLRMRWHRGAAKAAQRWADACVLLRHDNATGRYIDNYGSCGQNIFIASHKVPWRFAIETWWLEKDDFKYGKKNNLTVVGHYTQMVWATTHEVGCGIAKCYHYGNYKYSKAKLYFNYVCNYCPAGNHPHRVGIPYRKGRPCGNCPRKCKRNLCHTSCNAADQWSNCRDLYNYLPGWLCNTDTPEGRKRHTMCKATCTCKKRINN